MNSRTNRSFSKSSKSSKSSKGKGANTDGEIGELIDMETGELKDTENTENAVPTKQRRITGANFKLMNTLTSVLGIELVPVRVPAALTSHLDSFYHEVRVLDFMQRVRGWTIIWNEMAMRSRIRGNVGSKDLLSYIEVAIPVNAASRRHPAMAHYLRQGTAAPMHSWFDIVRCECGTVFCTNFPLESCPPQAKCPFCGAYHHSKRAYSKDAKAEVEAETKEDETPMIRVTGNQAASILFDASKDIPTLTEAEVVIESVNTGVTVPQDSAQATTTSAAPPPPEAGVYSIRMLDNTHAWTLVSKVVLSEDSLYKVATLLYDSQIPSGKTVQLQADAHVAGSYTWIGMVASFDETSIPFATVSADIGCGLSILPLVYPDSAVGHLTVSNTDTKAEEATKSPTTTTTLGTGERLSDFQTRFMLNARSALFRGKRAESGDASNVRELFREALAFVDDGSGTESDIESCIQSDQSGIKSGGEVVSIKIEHYRRELEYLFTTLDIAYGNDVMQFASRFMQSLGSSGNHFIELTQSTKDGRLYSVTHSGSRGLGALVYTKISELAHLYHGSNIAIHQLATLYYRAFDVLCFFAQINRIMCGMAVARSMGLVTNGAQLKQVMLSSPMFGGKNADLADDQRTKLLFGLTHNGIKTFVNHTDKQIIRVMSKGAIVLSRRSDIGIVALRAGEGCDLFILNNPEAKWVEVSNTAESHRGSRDSYNDYLPVYNLDQTDLCFAGHGAGRSGSATSTSKKSTFRDMMDYYHRVGFIGNLSPGVIGDNPEIAYKSPAEIREYLPLAEASYHTTLKTLVNHKEGIHYRRAEIVRFAEFCVANYEQLTEDEKLWLDVGLIRSEKGMAPIFQDQLERIRCFECRSSLKDCDAATKETAATIETETETAIETTEDAA